LGSWHTNCIYFSAEQGVSGKATAEPLVFFGFSVIFFYYKFLKRSNRYEKETYFYPFFSSYAAAWHPCGLFKQT
jgi:hypothetical protein